MNIKDLPVGSYTPVKLNINNLEAGSYTPVTPKAPPAIIPAEQSTFGTLTGPLREGISGLGTLYGGSEQGIASKLYQNVQAGAKDIQAGGFGGDIRKANLPLIAKGVVKAGLRTAGDVAGTIFAPIGAAMGATGINKVFEYIGELSQKGGKYNPINLATDTKLVQDFVMRHPNLEEDFGRALNLAFAGMEKGKIDPKTIIPRTIKQVKGGVTTAYSLPQKIKDYRTEKLQFKIDKEIDELLTKTKGIQGKTQLGAKKGTDYKKIISDKNIAKGLKVENSKINPDESISTIQNRIDNVMIAKSQMLPFADKYVKNPTREQLRTGAYKYIESKGLLPADEAVLKGKIDIQVNALPKDMPVSQMDVIRAKGRASGKNAQGISLENEYSAIESSARDIVFEATDNLPIDTAGEFAKANTYVKDMLNTQEFLNKTIRGQIVKGGRLTKLTGRVTGGVIGSTGGFWTGLIGQEVGAQIADIIVNNQLGSSLKMRMIKNLTDNPQVLKDVNGILSKMKDYKPLQLPPAEKGGFRSETRGGKTIPLGARSQSKIDAQEIARIQRDLKASQAIPMRTTDTTVSKNTISPTLPQSKPKVNIPKADNINSLIQAKGKTLDEFLKTQPVSYHGSPTPLKSFSNKKGGAYFTEEYADATGFAGTPDNVYEGYLNFKKPLVIDAKGAKWDKLNTKYGKSTQEVISNAQKDGFDGVVFKNIVDNIGDTADWGGQSTVSYAYKPQDSFINKSELISIWKEANKKVNLPKADNLNPLKYKSAEEFVKAQTNVFHDTLSFVKKWTTYNNMLNKGGANLSTYNRLKNEITPEVYKELSKYKPKEPIELYRFQRKGTQTPILSSWSKDKQWVEDMAELPNMEFIKKTFSPDEILVDIDRIPSKNELTDIGEVIIKAKNYRNVSSETTKSQLTSIWKEANKKVNLPKKK